MSHVALSRFFDQVLITPLARRSKSMDQKPDSPVKSGILPKFPAKVAFQSETDALLSKTETLCRLAAGSCRKTAALCSKEAASCSKTAAS